MTTPSEILDEAGDETEACPDCPGTGCIVDCPVCGGTGCDSRYCRCTAGRVPKPKAEQPSAHDAGHPHLINGEFQSDKYPICPRGKVPLSCKDPTAQDLLWEYAQRRRAVDAEFATDLELALKTAGFDVPRLDQPNTEVVERVAKAIYHYEDGLTDEDFLAVNGKARLPWGELEHDGHDDPASTGQLQEWERDEYRSMALAALSAIPQPAEVVGPAHRAAPSDDELFRLYRRYYGMHNDAAAAHRGVLEAGRAFERERPEEPNPDPWARLGLWLAAVQCRTHRQFPPEGRHSTWLVRLVEDAGEEDEGDVGEGEEPTLDAALAEALAKAGA
jgi:hypothetical protein